MPKNEVLDRYKYAKKNFCLKFFGHLVPTFKVNYHYLKKKSPLVLVLNPKYS
jgi:hypothetical protein